MKKKTYNYRTWKYSRPPFRPSKEDIEIYETAYKENNNLAVMGFTPELRILAYKYNNNVDLIDKNEENYDFLNEELDRITGSKVTRKNENFLKVNWLELDVKEKYDIIVGDGILNMLPPHLHDQALTNIYNALKPNGQFVVRFQQTEKPKFKDAEEVLKWWRTTKHDFFTVLVRQMFDVFRGDKDVFNYLDFDDWLNDLLKKGILKQEEKDMFYEDFFSMNFMVFYPKIETIEETVKKFFTIERTQAAKDYDSSEINPVYFLRKEKK